MAQPFPPSWDVAIRRSVKMFHRLHREEQERLKKLVQVFVAEKRWEGHGGLQLDDEHKAMLAAQACILVLELGIDAYAKVETILVYPGAVFVPGGAVSYAGPAAIVSGPRLAVGVMHSSGIVVLSSHDAWRDAYDDRTGSNVVFHEFAHVLDSTNGAMDGIPALRSDEASARWKAVVEDEFARISGLDNEPPVLDLYARTSVAEFFAVATEHFFERPKIFQSYHRELYDLLARFYRQDPAARLLDHNPRLHREHEFRRTLAEPDPSRRRFSAVRLRRLDRDDLVVALAFLILLIACAFMAWAAKPRHPQRLGGREPQIGRRTYHRGTD